MKDQIKVGVIYGSTRPGRFCDTVAHWAAERIAEDAGFAVVLIDPANPGDGALGTMRRLVDQCDAFVIVTPEYNHGYPAPLKSLIDSIGAEW